MATNDPPPRRPEARRLRVWELKQQGWTQRDLAEAFGVAGYTEALKHDKEPAEVREAYGMARSARVA